MARDVTYFIAIGPFVWAGGKTINEALDELNKVAKKEGQEIKKGKSLLYGFIPDSRELKKYDKSHDGKEGSIPEGFWDCWVAQGAQVLWTGAEGFRLGEV
jgi:hypothetical protein